MAILIMTVDVGDSELHLYDPTEKDQAINDLHEFCDEHDCCVILYEAFKGFKTWEQTQVASVIDGEFMDHTKDKRYTKADPLGFTQRYL